MSFRNVIRLALSISQFQKSILKSGLKLNFFMWGGGGTFTTVYIDTRTDKGWQPVVLMHLDLDNGFISWYNFPKSLFVYQRTLLQELQLTLPPELSRRSCTVSRVLQLRPLQNRQRQPLIPAFPFWESNISYT